MQVTNKTVVFYWTVLKDSVVKFIDDDMQAHAAAIFLFGAVFTYSRAKMLNRLDCS